MLSSGGSTPGACCPAGTWPTRTLQDTQVQTPHASAPPTKEQSCCPSSEQTDAGLEESGRGSVWGT